MLRNYFDRTICFLEAPTEKVISLFLFFIFCWKLALQTSGSHQSDTTKKDGSTVYQLIHLFPDSYIYNLVRTCSRVLGRNVSPRMLRKGLGIHTKELGLQDEVRRMIMGHSDVKTTIEAYSDYSVKDVTREISMKVSPQGGFSPVSRGGFSPMSRGGMSSEPQGVPHEQCPFCGGVVEPDMLICPHCWQEIQRVCENCKRFINIKWKKCVYCGADVRKKPKYDLAALINLDTIGFQVNSIGANLNELGRMHKGFFSTLVSGGGGGISGEDCYFVTIRRCVDNLTGKVTVSTVGPPCYYYDDEDNKKEGQKSKEECRGQATSDKRFGLMLPHEDCTFDIIEDCGEFDIGEFAEGDGDGFCVGSFLLSIYVGLVVFIDFLKRQKKRTET